MEKINIGKLIQEACKNKQLAEARIANFFSMPYSEIEKMYSPEDIYEFNLVYCDRMVERVMAKITTK